MRVDKRRSLPPDHRPPQPPAFRRCSDCSTSKFEAEPDGSSKPCGARLVVRKYDTLCGRNDTGFRQPSLSRYRSMDFLKRPAAS
ncbi:MAG: hypothetical protein ACT6RN_19080 [Agrobacterium sp.]|uniref:hypothetical protein n=1 Tax=Agrobacterium sp. TaxID=361 RepID=UPI0040379CA1